MSYSAQQLHDFSSDRQGDPMNLCMKAITSLTASMVMLGVAFAQPFAPRVNDGVSAYRAGDFETAWSLLELGAKDGSAKAQRYLGYLILEGHAPATAKAELSAGVELLKRAALSGDYVALVRLEDLRRQKLGHSPSLDDMIKIETARAGSGDPVSAWRLAKRFETGEGVMVSERDEAKWLEVAAVAETSQFPKAGEAAFRLCEINAMGGDAGDSVAARRWCGVAADSGHAGAAIVLHRLASLQG